MGARRRATFWSARRQRQSRSAGTLRLPLKCSTTVQCSPSSHAPPARDAGSAVSSGVRRHASADGRRPGRVDGHRRRAPRRLVLPSAWSLATEAELERVPQRWRDLRPLPARHARRGSGVAFRTRGSAGGRVCVCRVWCVSPITKKTVTATHYGQRSSSSEAASSTWSGEWGPPPPHEHMRCCLC